MLAQPHLLSDQQFQVVLGSLMGDGNLSPPRATRSVSRLPIGHGAKQSDYLEWKTALLGNIKHSAPDNDKGAMFVDFTPLPDLANCSARSTSVTARSSSLEEYLKALTPLALAIWYMDDGSLHLALQGTPAAHHRRQRPYRDLRGGNERRVASAPS